MIIEVEKKVKETVEVKTPAYFKGPAGVHCINESGDLIEAGRDIIVMWRKSHKDSHASQMDTVLRFNEPCSREEFTRAYHAALANIQAAVDGVVII